MSRKRVSYVIPLPESKAHVRRLQLPPFSTHKLGATGPILIPYSPNNDSSRHAYYMQSSSVSSSPTSPMSPPPLSATSPGPRPTPRHRLGVSALALDCTTVLTGKSAPEGILYSGGRDGMVISWDLGVQLRKRIGLRSSPASANRLSGRWEMMTGWADDVYDEDPEDFDPISDGDILGDVTLRRRRPSGGRAVLDTEPHWEVDVSALQAGTPNTFRQRAQMHSDWINDILLCNQNQTVVTASSDGTVKTWAPHTVQEPSLLGCHSDYVRCVAHCREQGWVASGSLDRTVKLWDLSVSQKNPTPLITLNPTDASSPKSSVYALATDPAGRAIASGSPEKIVRLWDPRSGKRTGKLVGHTDNIRSILFSEDSRYLLTASADASIKLWSLSTQRCLHTFTHHTDSVWALHSNHPSLEIFYSGDRSGMVCRVDVEGCGSDVSEGECVVLCQNQDQGAETREVGINAIAALEDGMMWTASGSSTIRRWRVPPRRSARMGALGSVGLDSEPLDQDPDADKSLYGIPLESLVKLSSPNDGFAPYLRSKGAGPDAEVATLYSAASVMSVPHATTGVRSPMRSSFSARKSPTSPIRSSNAEDVVPLPHSARTDYEMREIAADAVPLYPAPDYKLTGEDGLVRCVILNDRIHALTVDTSGEVGVWDIVRCVCLGMFSKEDVTAASLKSNSGGDMEERSARERIEVVRERIEGETVITGWATADTKSGMLTIHVNERCFEAEVYSDEVGIPSDGRIYNDETKLNIGKWVLRNLFLGFIREEQRQRKNPGGHGHKESSRSRTSLDSQRHSRRFSITSTSVISSAPNMVPAMPPRIIVPTSPRSSPLMTPMIPIHTLSLYSKDGQPTLISIPQSPPEGTVTPVPGKRVRSGTVDGTMGKDSGDYFSHQRPRKLSTPGTNITTPTEESSKSADVLPTTPGGGFMGRLKNLGKPKRPPSETTSSPVISSAVPAQVADVPPDDTLTADPPQSQEKTPAQALLSQTISPPPSTEVPLHPLPYSMNIIVASESGGSSHDYRGTVGSMPFDAPALEEAMPIWLLEYLLFNRIPTVPQQVKISFVLVPWDGPDDEERLPELLNSAQSKLTANRMLRVRKLVTHVKDKLERLHSSNPSSRAASIRSSLENHGIHHHSGQPAEDSYEILCNEVLLPLDMTLASVRQYVWRQSSELIMQYRRKRRVH